jgi:hypothetical protein
MRYAVDLLSFLKPFLETSPYTDEKEEERRSEFDKLKKHFKTLFFSGVGIKFENNIFVSSTTLIPKLITYISNLNLDTTKEKGSSNSYFVLEELNETYGTDVGIRVQNKDVKKKIYLMYDDFWSTCTAFLLGFGPQVFGGCILQEDSKGKLVKFVPESNKTDETRLVILMQDGGPSLDDIIKEKASDHFEKAEELGQNVLEKIKKLARHRIVLPDIKPLNVVVNVSKKEIMFIDFDDMKLALVTTDEICIEFVNIVLFVSVMNCEFTMNDKRTKDQKQFVETFLKPIRERLGEIMKLFSNQPCLDFFTNNPEIGRSTFITITHYMRNHKCSIKIIEHIMNWVALQNQAQSLDA